MKIKLIFFFMPFLFVSNFAYSHGEDKLGPHDGYIKMPGSFHTEVVPVGKNKVKIFLLDIEWKNPSIKNSEVQIIFKSKQEFKGDCKVKDNFFECTFPANVSLSKKAQLLVSAQREGQVGNQVTYITPLSLNQKEQTKDAHEMHH